MRNTSVRKVVFVTPEFLTDGEIHPGGLATYTLKTALGLIEKGVEVQVVQGSSTCSDGIFQGIRYHMVKTKNRPVQTFLKNITFGRLNRTIEWITQSFLLNQKLKKLHKKEKFSIVHYSSYKAVGLFRIKKVPGIVRISSLQRWWDLFEGRGLSKDRQCSHGLELFTTERFRHIFGPGDLILRLLRRRKPGKSTYHLLQTSVPRTDSLKDSSLYREFDPKKEKRYLLYFGTLSELKGFSVLKQLVPEIIENLKVEFVLIGKSNINPDGTTARALIQNAVHENMRSDFHYFDSQPFSKIIPFIENCQGVIIPSRIDNFPNTAIEAMKYGKVVFASDRASLGSLIKDGYNGYLCRYNRVSDYYQKIKNWLNSDESYKYEIEKNILQTIPSLASDKIMDELLSLYELAINDAKTKS